MTSAPFNYTASGCLGMISPGTGSWAGTWHVPGVWVGP